MHASGKSFSLALAIFLIVRALPASNCAVTSVGKTPLNDLGPGMYQGFQGGLYIPGYVAAKHALIGYTRAIAAEWGRFGITCNAICPGFVATAMAAGFDAARLGRRIPAGRLGTAEEIARVAGFLAAEESGYLNGSIVAVDGGLLAGLGIERQERI